MDEYDRVPTIVDLKSANGTGVRDMPIKPVTSISIAPGEAIVIGGPCLMVLEPPVQGIYEIAIRAADGNINVLVLGETAAGEEEPLLHEPAPASLSKSDRERIRIVEALAACAGNQSRAARLLQMPRRTFVSKLEAYEIPRPQKGATSRRRSPA
jgi:hypothetical protein